MGKHQFVHFSEGANWHAPVRQHILGIEPAGTPLQQTAQRLIHRERDELRRLYGAVSFGRSVAAFLPALNVSRLPGLLSDFRRVLVLGSTKDIAAAVETSRTIATEISGGMRVIGAEDTTFLSAARATISHFALTSSGSISVLTEDASAASILELQVLQTVVGLTPLPGAFLRGTHCQVATVAYHNDARRLLASATLVGLEGGGPELADTAIMVGVCVDPAAQGQGIGSAITAAGLLEAHRSFGARRVIAVVDEANTVAIRTNAKFGLAPLVDQSAVYLEFNKANGCQ